MTAQCDAAKTGWLRRNGNRYATSAGAIGSHAALDRSGDDCRRDLDAPSHGVDNSRYLSGMPWILRRYAYADATEYPYPYRRSSAGGIVENDEIARRRPPPSEMARLQHRQIRRGRRRRSGSVTRPAGETSGESRIGVTWRRSAAIEESRLAVTSSL